MPTKMPEPSNTNSPEPVVEPASAPATPPQSVMPLQQWCEVKSQAMGRSVEILSGFFRKMRKLDIDNLTPAAWETKFQQYKTAPAGRGK